MYKGRDLIKQVVAKIFKRLGLFEWDHMEWLVLDKSGSRLWLNMYRVTRNFSILHIQGNLGNSCGNRNQGYFSCEIRNPRLWNPE